MSNLIKRMAHVGLEVPDLDASVSWATTVMGMREVDRIDGTAYLTHAVCHHSLELRAGERSAVDHVSMQAHDVQALEALLSRLRDAGVEIIDEAWQEPGVTRAIRFLGPDQHLIEVFVDMLDVGPLLTGAGVQPRKFGHPTLTCPDIAATRDFFADILDFRLSDEVGDVLAFLRCSVDHHGIGIQKGAPGINHYAWEVENLATLGQLGDTLAANDGSFIWGPGRHGAGQNLFTYHFDPAGCVVEYYADLYQVWDERTYVPGKWRLDDPRGQNLWGPQTPEDLMRAFTPLAQVTTGSLA
jgi:catechol 2,3-dioxygenase-like lactoylglutathione lyase family enzyme